MTRRRRKKKASIAFNLVWPIVVFVVGSALMSATTKHSASSPSNISIVVHTDSVEIDKYINYATAKLVHNSAADLTTVVSGFKEKVSEKLELQRIDSLAKIHCKGTAVFQEWEVEKYIDRIPCEKKARLFIPTFVKNRTQYQEKRNTNTVGSGIGENEELIDSVRKYFMPCSNCAVDSAREATNYILLQRKDPDKRILGGSNIVPYAVYLGRSGQTELLNRLIDWRSLSQKADTIVLQSAPQGVLQTVPYRTDTIPFQWE